MDLEKAFDGVPRKVTCWTMRKLDVDEWLISAVVAVFVDARTVIGQLMIIVKFFWCWGWNASGFILLLFAIITEAI